MITCPVNGEVLFIKYSVSTKEHHIGIFIPLWRDHSVLAPVSGKILKIIAVEGTFEFANDLKRSRYNTKAMITIRDDRTGILIQMDLYAGAFARRIELYKDEGERVQQKEKIGYIFMGSRCELMFRGDFKVQVKERQSVDAGQILYL